MGDERTESAALSEEDRAVRKLLDVLSDLHADGTLEDVYAFHAGGDGPLEWAVDEWARLGYPGSGK